MDKPWGIERDNVSKAVDPPTFVFHFQKKKKNKQTKTQIYPSFNTAIKYAYRTEKRKMF